MRWLLAILLLADAIPCGGRRPRQPSYRPPLTAPAFVQSGSGPILVEGKRVVRGADVIRKVTDPSQAAVEAGKSARDKLARELLYLGRDILRAAHATPAKWGEAELSALWPDAKQIVAGLEVKTWTDRDGTLIGVVELEEAIWVTHLRALPQLELEGRARIALRADAVFDERAEEQLRHAKEGDYH